MRIEGGLEGLILLPQFQSGSFTAQKTGFQGELDAGMTCRKQLIIAIVVLLIAQAHAVGVTAAVDGKIVGTGGELDISLFAGGFCIENPELVDLVDLFDENFCHKASPLDMIPQFSPEGKCFSVVDAIWISAGKSHDPGLQGQKVLKIHIDFNQLR